MSNNPNGLAVTEHQQDPIEPGNRAEGFLKASKIAIASAFVAFEVNPITNEGLRYGSLGLALTETHNPLVGAAVLGGTTLAVEGTGALAAASLLATDKASAIMARFSRKANGEVSTGGNMSKLAESGIALTLGSSALLGLKQIEDPSRKVEHNRRYGAVAAAGLAGVFAVEGALISEGVLDISDPKKVGAAVIGLAGLHFGALKLRKHRTKIKQQDNML